MEHEKFSRQDKHGVFKTSGLEGIKEEGQKEEDRANTNSTHTFAYGRPWFSVSFLRPGLHSQIFILT